MRWATILAVVVFGALLLASAAAVAQTTGGSFGGGDFSSGSSGSSGSSNSSSDDHGSGLSLVVYLVIEVIASPWIPWPLKLVLATGIVGIAVVVAIVRKRRRR